MGRVSDIAGFVKARVAEDVQLAKAAGHGCGYVLHEHNAGWVEVAFPPEHNARPGYELRLIRQMGPERVLRECALKEAIMGEHCEVAGTGGGGSVCSTCGTGWPCVTVRSVAAVYDDGDARFDPAWVLPA